MQIEGLWKGPAAQVDCLFMAESDQGLIAERYTSVSVEATDLQEGHGEADRLWKCRLIGVIYVLFIPFQPIGWLINRGICLPVDTAGK